MKEGVLCGPTNRNQTNRSLTIYPRASFPKRLPTNCSGDRRSGSAFFYLHSAIELTKQGLAKIGVKPSTIPVLGVVTAGEPILAVEDASDFFPIPPNLSSEDGSLFMLTIRGESMINAGILDGDNVIVRKQETAQNGDIVIAMTAEDEATCKRFYKEKNHFRLQPENDLLEPIILDQVSILGRVVGLYRSHIY